ncbi:protein SLX4IP isoform X2 [Genypterus blacodes]|uniref:protein SLX4IP isoform X2 n=1 Tax=Genypterus blacodes TaxID=154954 RepID=UPI003F770652
MHSSLFCFNRNLPAAMTVAPLKITIKCGNFAVLVDLHVLPLGGQEDTSWFTAVHIEEVTTLVRGALDHRVKQYTDSLRNRSQPKHRKELPPASTFSVKGRNFSLVANFLKRHFNLRCVVTHFHGELRVFPERYVVCVRCPEDASARHGNPSSAVTELSEQSTSEYFSRAGETQEPFHSSTKTKKAALQKIAEQAGVRREPSCSSPGGGRQIHRGGGAKDQRQELRPQESESSPRETASGPGERAAPEAHQHHVRSPPPGPTGSIKPPNQTESVGKQSVTHARQTENRLPDSVRSNETSGVLCQRQISHETSERCELSGAGEDPHPQKAKRTCLGRAPGTTRAHTVKRSPPTAEPDLLPLPPLPPAEARAESKAFPVSECKKTTVEVELLTPGKRAQRLSLTSNNTAQTNQNRLAASLRGLSVKPASSGSSISSRSTRGEEGSETVPRTSRLRRLKRS